MRRVLLLAALLCLPAAAIELASLSLGRLAGPGWALRGLQLDLPLRPGAPLRLRAARLDLPAPVGTLRDITLTCRDFTLAARAVHCAAGRLSLRHPQWRVRGARVRFDLDLVGPRRLRVDGLRLAGGRLALDLRQRGEGWRARLHLKEMALERLPPAWRAALPLRELQGRASGELSLRGGRRQPLRAAADLTVAALDFSDAASLHAGERLALRLRGSARRRGGQWQGEGWLRFRGGQLYLDPVYLAFDNDTDLRLRLRWDPAGGGLVVDDLQWLQPDVLTAFADGALRLRPRPAVARATVDLREARLPGFYATWLQPWLLDTALAELDTRGRLGGRLRWADGRVQGVSLRLAGVGLDDRRGRFAVHALDARLGWAAGDYRRGWLRWHDGALYGLPLGAARLSTVAYDDYLLLNEPARLEVLDGELQVVGFVLEGLRHGPLRWTLDARLTPVSLAALTDALRWPPLGGTLAAEIRRVHYQGGVLRVDGALEIRVFGGVVRVEHLTLQDPLGPAPVLTADVTLRDLDLAQMTARFDFGLIEGRLQGEVRGLRLVGWVPEAFDARLYTDHHGRRRISQRAIDNLTRVGGGLGAGLSRSFLGLFKTFGYDRLGLSCRLRNGVCEMRGVAPARNGYYIVKGRGLPRVDVIGYNQRVGWRELIERLKAIDTSRGPVIQ